MEKPESWIEGVLGTLFWPGGDPDAIRRAESTVRELSSNLGWVVNDVKLAANTLDRHWEGKGGDAFQQTAKKFATDADKYADQLLHAATRMETLADFIEEAQRESKVLWVTMAATLAAGAACSFITAGLSDAAAVAACGCELSSLSAVAARMAFVLSREAWAMGVLQTAMATVAKSFILGFSFSLLSSLVVKGVFGGQDVLDPSNWTANDLSKLLLDGMLVVGMKTLASTPFIASRLNGPSGVPSLRRYLIGGGISGAGLSAIFSGVSQFGFGGESPGELRNWGDMLKSTGIGLVSGLGASGVFYKAAVINNKAIDGGGISKTDVMRGTTGSFSDMINYVINYDENPALPKMKMQHSLAPDVPHLVPVAP